MAAHSGVKHFIDRLALDLLLFDRFGFKTCPACECQDLDKLILKKHTLVRPSKICLIDFKCLSCGAEIKINANPRALNLA
jgi:hypothetical protein